VSVRCVPVTNGAEKKSEIDSEPEELAGTAELTKEPKARAGIRTNLAMDLKVANMVPSYQR
jgi:hypothetical protein